MRCNTNAYTNIGKDVFRTRYTTQTANRGMSVRHAGCKEEMEAIEQAAKDAAHISPDNPMLPAATIIKANDPAGLRALGITIIGGHRRPLIE